MHKKAAGSVNGAHGVGTVPAHKQARMCCPLITLNVLLETQQVPQQINNAGIECTFVFCNVSHGKQVSKCMKVVQTTNDRLDALLASVACC